MKKRRPMAEINVVPYIDVMLVLLIIFMITAPLLNLGVEIELPQSNAAPMDAESEPLIVNVIENGDLYLSIGGESELIDSQALQTKVAAILRRNPEVPVLIGGDQNVGYGVIYDVMVLLQQAGAEKVGLMSDPLES
ncbi:MAG: protein TolR [Lysobacteraceae bacterium]|nr:MAG: protein TolR [Xanthomonadaceae bacterium]